MVFATLSKNAKFFPRICCISHVWRHYKNSKSKFKNQNPTRQSEIILEYFKIKFIEIGLHLYPVVPAFWGFLERAFFACSGPTLASTELNAEYNHVKYFSLEFEIGLSAYTFGSSIISVVFATLSKNTNFFPRIFCISHVWRHYKNSKSKFKNQNPTRQSEIILEYFKIKFIEIGLHLYPVVPAFWGFLERAFFACSGPTLASTELNAEYNHVKYFSLKFEIGLSACTFGSRISSVVFATLSKKYEIFSKNFLNLARLATLQKL